MNERVLTWTKNPRKTKLKLPPGATDSHCHVFGPEAQFPFAETSKLKPADATKHDLFALHDMMGIERCVIVQTAVHGFDLDVTTNAMQARPKTYLGIALVPADVSDELLDQLAKLNYRGVRFNYMGHLSQQASAEDLRALAPRLAARDLHLQIHMDASFIETLSPVLADLPITVVIDHIGRIDASQGINQAPYQALLKLLDHNHIWCKVSGCERASRQDPPYADAVPFARAIVERFGDRVVWGTDWPHPNYRTDPPDDGDLFDLIAQLAPDEKSLQALMVDNPNRLYRFDEL